MLLGAVVLSVTLVVLSGCMVEAGVKSVSTMVHSSTEDRAGEYIATVQLDQTPDAVYDAALKVANARGDVTVELQDKANHRLDLAKARDKVTIKISELEEGGSQVIIHARGSTEGPIPREITQSVTRALCKELGVTAKWQGQ